MHYIVTIVSAYFADRADEFDLWEIPILIEAEGVGRALFDALAYSRNNPLRELLGYRAAPVLHGVKDVDTALDSASLSDVRLPLQLFAKRIGSINGQQLQSLKALIRIELPYALIHIDDQQDDFPDLK